MLRIVLSFLLLLGSTTLAAAVPADVPVSATTNKPVTSTPATTQLFPRIAGAGGIFPITGDMPDRNAMHRVLINAMEDETTPAGTNRRLDIAARVANLYAYAGVPADKVKIAVVVHGKATPSILNDAAYQQHFGKPNPNAALISKLHAAGIEIFICGQALTQQGYAPSDIHTKVKLALSAVTKLADLQAAGYALIP